MRFLFGKGARGAVLSDNRGPWGGDAPPGGSGSGGSGIPSSGGSGDDKSDGPETEAGGGDGGNGGGSEPPRNPWGQPGPRKRRGPGAPRGDGAGGGSAFDDWLRRGRERLAGGFPGSGGSGAGPKRPYWLYGLAAFVLIWIAFTSIHRVGSQERGIITTFGRYERAASPGIAFTWPAPISRLDIVSVEDIRSLPIPEGQRENLILTGDQNVIDLAYTVRWNVKDPELFLFQMANPEETIREAAESSMRAVVSRVSLEEALGSGRSEIEQRVEQAMQQLLDEYGSGVAVQGISISQSAPPSAVNDAFLAVSAAQQQAQSLQNDARAYALQRTAQAQGDAAQFDQIYQQYRAAPEVTRRRIYYETMEEILARTDVTILESTSGALPYLPLPQVAQRPRVPPQPAQQQAQQGQPQQQQAQPNQQQGQPQQGAGR